jgi:hypothetical protein
MTPGSRAVAGVGLLVWVSLATKGECTVKDVLFVTGVAKLGVAAFPVSFNCTVKGYAPAAPVRALTASSVSEGDSTRALQPAFKLLPILLKVAGRVPALMHHW